MRACAQRVARGWAREDLVEERRRQLGEAAAGEGNKR
jgi:hypothetical protein